MYKVTTDYRSGMPSSPKSAAPFTMFACHDTEGLTGVAGAKSTISFLVSSATRRNASYHELWAYDEANDDFTVIKIVPPNRAAHSLNPTPPTYSPTKWVQDNLGLNKADPNQGVYAISIAGRVADVNRYAKNPKFLAHAKRRFAELSAELDIHTRAEHAQFNPATRTDWGKELTPALGGLRIEEDLAFTNDIKAVAPFNATVRKGTSLRLSPDLTAASAPWVAPDERTYTVIGEVKGVDFGAGSQWFVIVSPSESGLKVFHSQDIIKRTPLDGDTAALEADILAKQKTITSLNLALSAANKKIAAAKTALT